MTGEYAGQSLKWVRTLLGYPAKYASAQSAWEDIVRQGRVGLGVEPPLGSLAWFAIGMHGDVGLVCDVGWCLRMENDGAIMKPFGSLDHRYLGWSPADVLGEDKAPSTTHTEYGVMSTLDGHTWLDETFTRQEYAEQAAQGYREMKTPGEVRVVKREVTYTLGEWEPVQ